MILKGILIGRCKEEGHILREGKKQWICLTCEKVRNKARYHHYRGRYKAYIQKWYKDHYQKMKEIANRAKMVPCADCGVQYNPWIMQFDHRDIHAKKFTIGKTGKMSSEKRLIEEIAKCDVVCANCHCDRTHKNLDQIQMKRNYPVVGSR